MCNKLPAAEEIAQRLLTCVTEAHQLRGSMDPTMLDDRIASTLLLAQVFSAQPSKSILCIDTTMLTLPLLNVVLLTESSAEWADNLRRDPSEVSRLPDATDPFHLRVMGIMASLLAMTFVTGKIDLLQRLIHTMYRSAFQYGASIYLSCAAVYLGGMLCASEVPDDLGRCVRTGSAGMQLFARFKSSPLTTGSMKARIAAPFWAICAPWGQHWRDAAPEQERIGVEAVHDGEFEYSGYCVWHAAAAQIR
jgi:hypothetical protein